jgi:demethylsterigmatocystin 6-O-methyltransferase
MIEEVAEDEWAATNITKALAIPGYKAGIRHKYVTLMNQFLILINPCSLDETLSSWQALPSFLKDTSYQNPSDSLHTCFQRGHNTDLHAFKWAAAHPESFKNFNLWMTASRMGKRSWLDEFNFEQEVASNSTPEEVIFVDVGGGIGTQCLNLRTHFPHLKGRVILQDLATPIKQALPVDGMEAMVHDFWTEQPVEGLFHSKQNRKH